MFIAGRLADVSFPSWGEALWKLAVISLITQSVDVFVGMASATLGWLVALFVFWGLLMKWFGLDLWGALIITVAVWAVNFVLGMLLVMSM